MAINLEFAPQWLLNLKAGDLVLFNYYGTLTEEKVTSTTPTMISVRGLKFSRANGSRIGDRYCGINVREWTEKASQEAALEKWRRGLLNKISKLEKRGVRESLTDSQLEAIVKILEGDNTNETTIS